MENRNSPNINNDINKKIADKVKEYGLTLDVKFPQQIISIVCKDSKAYIGISLSENNLSNWTGGMHRFAYEDSQISRAEFKLLEAIDLFNINLNNFNTALDLGAAPGGWTRVLRKYGLEVIAVDPANLHPDIAADAGVTHFLGLAQDYLNTSNKFDLIVNDMRMDAKESSGLMGLASKSLNQNGLVIMTLKLPRKGMQRITNECIKILEKWYKCVGARQLFNNRSEVTLVLKYK